MDCRVGTANAHAADPGRQPGSSGKGRPNRSRASQAGHLEIVRMLLLAGSNKDVADNDGRAALHAASIAGAVEIVR